MICVRRMPLPISPRAIGQGTRSAPNCRRRGAQAVGTVLRPQKLLELDEQLFLVTDRDRLQSLCRRVLIDEPIEGRPEFKATSGAGAMLGKPVGRGLESGPAGYVGGNVDLVPFWVPSAVMELIDPSKELAHEPGNLVVTFGVLRPCISYQQRPGRKCRHRLTFGDQERILLVGQLRRKVVGQDLLDAGAFRSTLVEWQEVNAVFLFQLGERRLGSAREDD